MSATREEVYEAIDSEREYQEGLWDEVPRTTDEFALYVNEYASRLQAHCTDPRVRERTGESELDFFRKVGALCVAAMEQHGAPKRREPRACYAEVMEHNL